MKVVAAVFKFGDGFQPLRGTGMARHEYQIALEKEELEEYPEEEAEELALIYNARGLGMDEARAMARALLTRAFLSDALASIADDAAREAAEAQVTTLLEAAL